MRRAALGVCGAILVASAAAAATRLRSPPGPSGEDAASGDPGTKGGAILSTQGAGKQGLAQLSAGGPDAGSRARGPDALRMAERSSPTLDDEHAEGVPPADDSAASGDDASGGGSGAPGPSAGGANASAPVDARRDSDAAGPGSEGSVGGSAEQSGSSPALPTGADSAEPDAAEEDGSAAESSPDAAAEGGAGESEAAGARGTGEGAAVADEGLDTAARPSAPANADGASEKPAGSSGTDTVSSVWKEAEDEVTVPLAMSPKRSSSHVSATYQQYDPNPGPSMQCPALSVLSAVEKDPVLPGQRHARSVARHVAAFTSLWDEQEGDNRVAGQLYAPSRLPLARRGAHFLTCLDGRARFAVLGAPGGDLGQFATVLAAVETLALRTRQQGRSGRGTGLLTAAQVEDALRGYIESNIGVREGASPHKFAICTDRAALERWAERAGAESLREPVDASTRARALSSVDKAEHVGDSHLRAMLLHSEEYHIRRDLLAALLQTAYSIVLDEGDALHDRMMHAVMEGYHEEQGLVTVQTLCTECPSAEALVVPTVVDGGGSVESTYLVHHPDAARAARHEFARVLARQFPEEVASATALAAAADDLAASALDATLSRVLGPQRSVRVDVTFADEIAP